MESKKSDVYYFMLKVWQTFTQKYGRSPCGDTVREVSQQTDCKPLGT